MSKLQAHIHDHCGQEFLFYVEPNGDDSIIHMIGNASFGQVDIKLSGPDATMEDAWRELERDRFYRAGAHLYDTIQQLEEVAKE